MANNNASDALANAKIEESRIEGLNKGVSMSGLDEETLPILCNHGYFSKDVARYLTGLLRQAGLPCEIGFDRNLPEKNSAVAQQLRSTLKDPNPFYFLAFPVHLRDKAEKVLATTSYPLPEDDDASRQARILVEKRRQIESMRKFRKTIFFLMIFGMAVILISSFVWLSKTILG